MTNAQKYKTLDERIAAFDRFCKQPNCDGCPVAHACGQSKAYAALKWLELTFVDDIEKCPFCGSACAVENVCTNEDQESKYVACLNEKCMYQSATGKSAEDAIVKHNAVCMALFNSSRPDEISIGDTVAYRTLEEENGKPEWECFTVRAMDKDFFYERKDHTGFNIARKCCFKVNLSQK